MAYHCSSKGQCPLPLSMNGAYRNQGTFFFIPCSLHSYADNEYSQANDKQWNRLCLEPCSLCFFFFLLVFSFKKQLDCYGNAKLNVSKPGDDTIRKYSPTTLPSVFPQRIFVGFPVFLLPQKPFSHGYQSFQVNLAYIIIFLIERSYRYLGKVAWRMIAAAKASAPLPSRSMVYMAISGPFLSLPNLLECRQ